MTRSPTDIRMDLAIGAKEDPSLAAMEARIRELLDGIRQRLKAQGVDANVIANVLTEVESDRGFETARLRVSDTILDQEKQRAALIREAGVAAQAMDRRRMESLIRQIKLTGRLTAEERDRLAIMRNQLTVRQNQVRSQRLLGASAFLFGLSPQLGFAGLNVGFAAMAGTGAVAGAAAGITIGAAARAVDRFSRTLLSAAEAQERLAPTFEDSKNELQRILGELGQNLSSDFGASIKLIAETLRDNKDTVQGFSDTLGELAVKFSFFLNILNGFLENRAQFQRETAGAMEFFNVLPKSAKEAVDEIRRRRDAPIEDIISTERRLNERLLETNASFDKLTGTLAARDVKEMRFGRSEEEIEKQNKAIKGSLSDFQDIVDKNARKLAEDAEKTFLGFETPVEKARRALQEFNNQVLMAGDFLQLSNREVAETRLNLEKEVQQARIRLAEKEFEKRDEFLAREREAAEKLRGLRERLFPAEALRSRITDAIDIIGEAFASPLERRNLLSRLFVEEARRLRRDPSEDEGFRSSFIGLTELNKSLTTAAFSRTPSADDRRDEILEEIRDAEIKALRAEAESLKLNRRAVKALEDLKLGFP